MACTYGRFGEGEDFPGAEMNAAIVVELPLSPQSGTVLGLAKFLDQIFPGEGRDVALGEAAAKRVAQVAGRPVRSETDRGLIVLLDRRMGDEQFITRLPGPLQNMIPVEDYAAIQPRIRQFFAPYLDFLLQLGEEASTEPDPSEKQRKVKKFLGACRFYFSEKHLPWNQDSKLLPRVREIKQLKSALRPLVP